MQETSKSGELGLPLVFDRPMAIIGGGRVDADLLRELAARGVALVGADGGGDTIGEAGLVPDAIIGDLDSLTDRAAWEARTRVIHIPEQLTSDFQKALYSTQAPFTLALGMMGKRIDHTLVAISAILKVAHERRALLIDEVDLAMAVSGPFRFTAEPGERISIHPIQPTSFRRSTGLVYPLNGLVLEPLGRLGMSNEAEGGPVEIEPEDDTPWLLILRKERLWDLIA